MRTNKRASAIILKGDTVLLIRRYRKERGEYFVFPGGGVESDESEEEACVREMKEELGIAVESQTKLFDFEYERIFGSGKKHDFYFLITKYEGEPHWMEDCPEGLVENEDNQYHMEWREVAEVPELPILPLEMKTRMGEVMLAKSNLARGGADE